MELSITSSGKSTSQVSLSDSVFGCDFNESLVHQVVNACIDNAHRGTKKQKNRSEVSGGGAKPWKQKGTGRARAGTTRGPIWRTGGRTFAARPHISTQKTNKKMYRAAFRSMLSELARLERIHVTDTVALETPKTKQLLEKLTTIDATNLLIVSDVLDKNLTLASRNLPRVSVCTASELNPLLLLRHERVLMSELAIKKLEESLS